MPTIVIYGKDGGQSTREVSAGIKLSEAITPACLETPCGGNGRCGKCRVVANGKLSAPSEQEKALLGNDTLQDGFRLSCLTTVEGDVTVFLSGENAVQAIRSDGTMPEFTPDPIFQKYGAAVDIGTTTLVSRLYSHSGALLAQATSPNPQRSFGADVITRIEKSLSGARTALAKSICDGINALLRQMESQSGVSSDDIDVIVLTGNTTMLYLLTDRDVDCLSHAPFIADELFGRWAESDELHFDAAPFAKLYLPRCMSAFVGADITTALLASQICSREECALLADIGTNGELVLWHKGKLLCCSTAAGPVFEGANISQGTQACSGAIDSVAWQNGKPICHTIDNAPAIGICGSGIIDAAAMLCAQEIIDETGAFSDDEDLYSLTDNVSLTQKDIRMVQLAKSAICAGILTLLESESVELDELSTLFIAGGFGSFLNLHSAAQIGLFPAEIESCASAIGNAALSGASMLLLCKNYLPQSITLAKMAKTIDLSSNPLFMDNYVECMSF